MEAQYVFFLEALACAVAGSLICIISRFDIKCSGCWMINSLYELILSLLNASFLREKNEKIYHMNVCMTILRRIFFYFLVKIIIQKLMCQI